MFFKVRLTWKSEFCNLMTWNRLFVHQFPWVLQDNPSSPGLPFPCKECLWDWQSSQVLGGQRSSGHMCLSASRFNRKESGSVLVGWMRKKWEEGKKEKDWTWVQVTHSSHWSPRNYLPPLQKELESCHHGAWQTTWCHAFGCRCLEGICGLCLLNIHSHLIKVTWLFFFLWETNLLPPFFLPIPGPGKSVGGPRN